MFTERIGSSGGDYTLTLDKIISSQGPPIIDTVECKFSYFWDWVRNTGSATLRTIDGVKVNMILHPLGIEGHLDFMSAAKPKLVKLPGGKTILIDRVILDLIGPDDAKAALIISNATSQIAGNEIIGTQNWEANKDETAEKVEIHAGRVGTSGGKFTLTLDKVLSGPPDVKRLVCDFSYVWNWVTNMGTATLQSIDDVQVDYPMFPMGIAGRLAFMASVEPGTEVKLPDGSTIIIYRVLFDLIGNNQSAAMMLGEDGNEILVTENWNIVEEETVKRSNKVTRATYSS
ncbi:hypothetical protein HWV62_7734 [Athelia sp. TMB]|nr:hypothetical protein HWV62_7734 [Athelia sp. TMB]